MGLTAFRRRGLAGLLAAAAAAAACAAGGEPSGAAAGRRVAGEAGALRGFALDVGCGDASMALEVAKGGRLFVQCVSPDEKLVEKARAAIDAAGLYGLSAAADCADPAELPYPDNCAALVFCGDELDSGLKPTVLTEMLRVLHPHGVALIGRSAAAAGPGRAVTRAGLEAALKEAGVAGFTVSEKDGLWARFTKPRPAGWDQWPCRNHDPGNSCASLQELPGTQYRMQWINEPLPAMASAGLALAGGRQYVLGLEYPGREQATPSIHALDAFTGMTLWSLAGKKALPIDRSMSHYSPEKSCSDFAAAEDWLYVLGGQTLYAFDGASGEIKLRVPSPAGAGSVWLYLACEGDRLVAGAGRSPRTKPGNYGMYYRGSCSTVVCLDRRTGRPLWNYRGAVWTNSLAVGEGKVFLMTGDKRFHALDLASGRELWAGQPAKLGTVVLVSFYRGKLWVLYNKTNNWLAGGRTAAVFSAADGKPLFEPTFQGVVHMLAFAGDQAVATPQHSGNPATAVSVEDGRELWKKSLGLGGCSPVFGSPRHLLARLGSGPGIINLEDRKARAFGAMRPTCFLPPVPAYGMLYVPVPGCNCQYPFRGNVALTPGPAPAAEKDNPLVKGPAFDAPAAADQGGWRSWRADALRSGVLEAKAGAALAPAWTATIPGRATALAAVGGLVCCGSTDRKLHALDAASGKPRWRHVAGGGIPVAPWVEGGRVYFGAEDGWVRCLRADDGRLVWKFRAALGRERTFAYGRPSSCWPAACGVAVRRGTAYFAAGLYPEYGTAAYAVDAASGQLKWKARGRAAVGGALAVDDKRLAVPSRWGFPSQVALDNPRGFGGCGGARGSMLTISGGDVLVASPELEYTHHVNNYNRFVAALPLVTAEAIYLRDGRNLTAEKRAAFRFDRGRYVPAAASKSGAPPPEAVLWRAWPGEAMTAAIKVGVVVFSGGDGKVYATGAADGRQHASAPVPGAVADLAWDDGRLLVLCAPGTIVCFRTGP